MNQLYSELLSDARTRYRKITRGMQNPTECGQVAANIAHAWLDPLSHREKIEFFDNAPIKLWLGLPLTKAYVNVCAWLAAQIEAEQGKKARKRNG